MAAEQFNQKGARFSMAKKISRWIFHPFLFAVYPILYLLVNNPEEVQPVSTVRSLVLSLVIAALALLVLRLLLRSWQRAALATSVLLVLFFTYGHVYALVDKQVIFGVMIGRHRYLVVLWLLLAVLGIAWAARRVKDPAGAGQNLNLVALVLLAFVLFQFVNFQARVVKAANLETQARMKELGIATITSQLNPPVHANLPDVYYIILDGYSRADVLKDEFGFDNSPFVNALEQRGFYVAQCSQSNYQKTALSLTASLNMEYLDPLGKKIMDARERWQSLGVYMRDNIVRHTLEELSYKTVAFETGHGWANVSDAYYYFTMDEPPVLETINPPGISSFEKMLLDTTALVTVQKRIESAADVLAQRDQAQLPAADSSSSDDDGVSTEEHAFFNLNSYTLKHFGDVPGLPSPKFVFAHVLSTHAPFVFAADGSYQYNPTDAGYLDTIQYTNQRILEVLDQILARSGPKPIIIIQADHNKPTSKYKTDILNAYYLPDGGNQDLYPTITPVNSFRLIFNRYFGANLPLLEDISYFYTKTPSGGYQFDRITDPGPGCPAKP